MLPPVLFGGILKSANDLLFLTRFTRWAFVACGSAVLFYRGVPCLVRRANHRTKKHRTFAYSSKFFSFLVMFCALRKTSPRKRKSTVLPQAHKQGSDSPKTIQCHAVASNILHILVNTQRALASARCVFTVVLYAG
jgi:hypothetical protein